MMNTHRQADSRIARALMVVLGFGLMAAVATANNYYVDVEWTGTESGTASEPYRTMKAAVDAANLDATTDTILIADGRYKSLVNGGLEDFSTNGIVITREAYIDGGYAGWQEGTTFDWTEGSRITRSAIVDLAACTSRAFQVQTTVNGEDVWIEGFTFLNASNSLAGAVASLSGIQYRTLYVTDSLFSNNTTTASGGACRIAPGYKGITVSGCDFVDNSAGADGGALYLSGSAGSYNLTVIDCSFTGNTAGSEGGAVYHGGRPAYKRVFQCTFEDNSAATRGGAVYSNDGTLTLRQSTFHGNTAPSGAAIGGVEYWCGGYVLENCLVYGNTGGYAVQAKGWRMTGSYSLDVLHSTIVSNPNGGLYAGDDVSTRPMRVRNSIVADNGDYGIYIASDTYTSANNNVYGHSVSNYYNCSADAGSISVDADFLSASDYHLDPTRSPCLDMGLGTNDTGVVVDLDGNARPYDEEDVGVDMGCYETPPPPGMVLSIR